MNYDYIFCSSENTPAYTTMAANEGVIKGIIVKLLPRWFRYGIWTAQKPYSDKWREYGARAKEAPCFILWLNNHYRGIANENWIKLIVINNSPQIFGLSSDLCPNTLTGMVNFDWVNGWKVLDSGQQKRCVEESNTGIEKWGATWNAFNSKTSQH